MQTRELTKIQNQSDDTNCFVSNNLLSFNATFHNESTMMNLTTYHHEKYNRKMNENSFLCNVEINFETTQI